MNTPEPTDTEGLRRKLSDVIVNTALRFKVLPTPTPDNISMIILNGRQIFAAHHEGLDEAMQLVERYIDTKVTRMASLDAIPTSDAANPPESTPSPAIERANLQGSLEAAQQIWGIYNARSRENPEEKMFDFEKWLPGQIEDWERQLAALDKLDKEQKNAL